MASTTRSGETIYMIHRNGGRPYRVAIKNQNVVIAGEDEGEAYNSLMSFTNYRKIFIGKDIRPNGVWTLETDDNFQTVHGVKISDTYVPIHGNSILICTEPGKYVYVGHQIYRFKTDDEIVDYISPIGNSDVPYPFAVGTQYIYLMLEHKRVARVRADGSDRITGVPTGTSKKYDPYRECYDINEIAIGMRYIQQQYQLQRDGKPYDHWIDTPDEERWERESRITGCHFPISTGEDERKLVRHRITAFKLDPSIWDLYIQWELFPHELLHEPEL